MLFLLDFNVIFFDLFLCLVLQTETILYPEEAQHCMDLYMMNCELLATCSALGYLEGETYHKVPDCLGE